MPPHLTEAATEWRPREVFWMVKHGIKMSAMPAFGPTHGDDTLWAMSAFVKQLPGTTAEQYAAIPGEEQGGGHHGDKAAPAADPAAHGAAGHAH